MIRNVKKPRIGFFISEKRLEEIVNNPKRKNADQVIADFNKKLKEMMERCK